MDFFKNKALLRMALIAAMVCYLPWGSLDLPAFQWELPLKQFFPLVKKVMAAENPPSDGVGGGVSPGMNLGWMEPLLLEEGDDLELTGIPEPEEYSRAHMLTYSSYALERGDIIGNIAIWTGLNEDTLISVNDIKNTRSMQIGQVIKIPNQDGIYYTVNAGDTLESIADKHQTTVSYISTANELFSDTLSPNERLFIPGARLDWVSRQEINGDLFFWPVTSRRITSPYGFRIGPFTGVRQFHAALDIAAPTGSPVRAAMAGRVSQVGYDDTWGNFVVINHHSGYRTFYAHLNVARVRAGSYVETGERIGDVGSTGLSTGPHLHFTAYKNGVTVNPRTLLR